MTRKQQGLRGLRNLVLAAAALNAGCLSCFHPTGNPPPDQVSYCHTIPPGCRNHVYVFFLHGIDPLDCANLSGVRDYVQDLGFIKTYYGQFFHAPLVAKEIRRLHEEDPCAHFALVGFDYGATMAGKVANALQGDGIFIDLVVYLGGSTLENTPEARPANVGRVRNILGQGWVGNGAELSDAVNLHYGDVSNFGSPAHHVTLETLAHELTALAARVPVVEPGEPVGASTAAATPPDAKPREEWDFLKPRSMMEEALEPDVKPTPLAPAPVTIPAVPAAPQIKDKPAPLPQRVSLQGWMPER